MGAALRIVTWLPAALVVVALVCVLLVPPMSSYEAWSAARAVVVALAALLWVAPIGWSLPRGDALARRASRTAQRTVRALGALVVALASMVALWGFGRDAGRGARDADGPLSPCTVPSSVLRGTRAECGFVDVPLDHAAPDGGDIRLHVMRLNARGERRGVVFFDPGGPALSATRTLAALDMNEQLPRPLRDAFDVVAVDTRGTEPSTALWCEGPTGDAIVAAHTRGEGRAKDHAARCLTEIGALAEHVGVAQIARDVDVVREGLGYDRVSWLGQSWGTWVAATYAELFPTRTRAVVLDSPLPPPPGSRGLDVELPADVISVPDRFALWCAREASCRVAGDVFAYAKRAAANIADDGVDILLPPPRQRLYRDEVRAIVWHALLDKGNWPQLARALVALDGGDARPLAKLASEIDMDTQLDEPGARHEVAHHTIRCANLTLDGCETEERWPVRYTPPPPLTRETPPPTLVIVVDADGRTPPAGGLQMAAAMNASLVRVGGFGHVAFGDDSPCATKHAVHFLLEPKRIASVVRCGPPTPP